MNVVQMSERLASSVMQRREYAIREMVQRTIGPSCPRSEVEMLRTLERMGMEARIVRREERGEIDERIELIAGCDVVEYQPLPNCRFK